MSYLGDDPPARFIGTGMLAVPVLAGSCAYAIAEGARWKDASLNLQPHLAPRFYAVIAVSIMVGLTFDFAGFNAVKMLFWSAILNGLLAPPLVIMVVLLTGDRKVMGNRVNSLGMKALGWACAIVMSAAAVALEDSHDNVVASLTGPRTAQSDTKDLYRRVSRLQAFFIARYLFERRMGSVHVCTTCVTSARRAMARRWIQLRFSRLSMPVHAMVATPSLCLLGSSRSARRS